MSQQLVRQWQAKAVSVSQTCRVPRISRSGYYAARQRIDQTRVCAKPLGPCVRPDRSQYRVGGAHHLYSRKVIGWATHQAMPAALVRRALFLTIQQRNPSPGLLVHSDRGRQYATVEYQALLNKYALVCSMSRDGNCWDTW